jgi:hypothetical protein
VILLFIIAVVHESGTIRPTMFNGWGVMFNVSFERKEIAHRRRFGMVLPFSDGI